MPSKSSIAVAAAVAALLALAPSSPLLAGGHKGDLLRSARQKISLPSALTKPSAAGVAATAAPGRGRLRLGGGVAGKIVRVGFRGDFAPANPSVVSDAEADARARISGSLELRLGPRLSWYAAKVLGDIEDGTVPAFSDLSRRLRHDALLIGPRLRLRPFARTRLELSALYVDESDEDEPLARSLESTALLAFERGATDYEIELHERRSAPLRGNGVRRDRTRLNGAVSRRLGRLRLRGSVGLGRLGRDAAPSHVLDGRIGLAYAPSPRDALSLSLDRELRDGPGGTLSGLLSRAGGLSPPTGAARERSGAVALGWRHRPRPGLLIDLSADAERRRLPFERSALDTLSLVFAVDYRLDRNWNLRLGYVHERERERIASAPLYRFGRRRDELHIGLRWRLASATPRGSGIYLSLP